MENDDVGHEMTYEKFKLKEKICIHLENVRCFMGGNDI